MTTFIKISDKVNNYLIVIELVYKTSSFSPSPFFPLPSPFSLFLKYLPHALRYPCIYNTFVLDFIR